jgi:hypothetical protein
MQAIDACSDEQAAHLWKLCARTLATRSGEAGTSPPAITAAAAASPAGAGAAELVLVHRRPCQASCSPAGSAWRRLTRLLRARSIGLAQELGHRLGLCAGLC